MSIATEQKVEQLLARVQKLEEEVAALRAVLATPRLDNVKDANAARPHKR